MAIESHEVLPMRSLNIGEIIVSAGKEEIVWTVLGSCLSVILHQPGRMSVLCHAQMPFKDSSAGNCYERCPNPCFNLLPDNLDNKFVKCSVELMIKYLKDNRCNLSKLNTTIIGGAAVIKSVNDKETVGSLNIKTAKSILSDNKIKINRELVGGSNGYTLWYYPNNDRLFVRIHKEKEKFELTNNR